MERRYRHTLCIALAGLVASGNGLAQAAASAPTTALDTQLRNEELQVLPQRQAFARYFRQAYARYPAIPAGTLESIAYVQTRWQHLQPDPLQDQQHAHNHMPAAYGVMGLYGGQGFADQVSEAAQLLGVRPQQVREDPLTNILAAAALLDQQIRQDFPAGDRTGLTGASLAPALEDIRPALERYAGFSPQAGTRAQGNIDDYARSSFAYDVLLALDRGVDDRGIVVPERPVQWERAFDVQRLIQLRAPMLRLDATRDRIEAGDIGIDPVTETLQRHDASDPGALSAENTATDIDAGIQSTDYGPAIWDPASSSNYTASRSAAVSAVTLHTAQGSYAGTISWFKNAAAQVSAHYVIRSSDGQVTQMVRNAHTAWHVRNHNAYTLGIEHEGYVDNSSWYTSAMYDASAALVRSFCAGYSAIPCASAYSGAPSSGIQVLADSVKIKGHQHFSGQTHTDPGINWNWARYYALLNPGSGGSGTASVLDGFESSVGHFATSPTYSGSTTGIGSGSTATRDCSTARNGACSLRVLLKDDSASSAAWSVRLLSGAGSPSSNTALTRSGGTIGFWVYPAGSGLSVAAGIDDSDGTERSLSRTLPANTWTYVSWSLTDDAQWNAWAGGNGAITAASVTLDAIWLYRAQTAYDVNVYVDDVQITN